MRRAGPASTLLADERQIKKGFVWPNTASLAALMNARIEQTLHDLSVGRLVTSGHG